MATRRIAKRKQNTSRGFALIGLFTFPVIAVLRWLKTPLDWIAAGCLVCDVIVLLVLVFFILPVARDSNSKLIELNAVMGDNQRAIRTNQEAIMNYLKEPHE